MLGKLDINNTAPRSLIQLSKRIKGKGNGYIKGVLLKRNWKGEKERKTEIETETKREREPVRKKKKERLTENTARSLIELSKRIKGKGKVL